MEGVRSFLAMATRNTEGENGISPFELAVGGCLVGWFVRSSFLVVKSS
jgi:hypothetical protein